MKIAVEGCAHGELEKIYQCIETLEAREGIKIDLLICCGDFQSVRNSNDLVAMAVPEKYLDMCTFFKYYNGERVAPVLTIFIGGNHEASNYLQELPYGGWVAPNIFYMGRSGVVQFGNIRIGGLSGIYKGRDYLQGLWESPPYTPNSVRSVYHIRSLDVFRLSQIKSKLQVMLSHDWPRGITKYGDVNNLLRIKPFLRDDVESNQLGSPPAEKLLQELKPDYWFAAHLHCRFAAIVEHDNNESTKFLALDKCLPKRRHLQILDLPEECDGDKILKYDAEWLAILKNTNHLLCVKNIDCYMPGPGGNERYDFSPTIEEIKNVENVMGSMLISDNPFVQTAHTHQPGQPKGRLGDPILNPQTVYICEKLGIDDPLQVLMARSGREMRIPNENINTSNKTPVTPFKATKMLLPAPVTPSSNETQDISQETPVTPQSHISLDTSTDSVPSATKKTFKRRNLAMYTPEADEHSIESSVDESPRSSKVTCPS